MIETIMSILLVSILVGCGIAAIYCIFMLIKIEVTFKNQELICDAIYYYQEHLIEEGQFDPKNILVDFSDMECFDVTLNRFWDWGYTRILPSEKFELIKPFISKSRKDNEE